LRALSELEELGVTEIALKVNFGGTPQREIMRWLERFAARVLPKISKR
jgi:hypothetical protein